MSGACTFKTFCACLAYSIIIGDSFSSLFGSMGTGHKHFLVFVYSRRGTKNPSGIGLLTIALLHHAPFPYAALLSTLDGCRLINTLCVSWALQACRPSSRRGPT